MEEQVVGVLGLQEKPSHKPACGSALGTASGDSPLAAERHLFFAAEHTLGGVGPSLVFLLGPHLT